MGPLTALVLATPVFGLAFTPPPASLSPLALANAVAQPAFVAHLPPLQLGGDDEDEDEDEPADDEDADEDRDGAREAARDDEAEDEAEDEEGGVSMEEYGALMRRRSEMQKIHKPLGIATWASMAVTLLLGAFQYANLYGVGALEDTPCVSGNGIIFGESQCTGTPFVHLTSAMLTTGLYAATFTLSLMMPDPDGLDEGDSDYASNLRTHKILRWVHFIGMISQLALGVVIANSESFGLDRANDFGTLQALSATHMALGFVTFGALTWAGALFTF
jgi:hypothetical protein